MNEVLNALLRSQGELHGKVDLIIELNKGQDRRLRTLEQNWAWCRGIGIAVITLGGLIPKVISYCRSA
jgi:hypothetical protein